MSTKLSLATQVNDVNSTNLSDIMCSVSQPGVPNRYYLHIIVYFFNFLFDSISSRFSTSNRLKVSVNMYSKDSIDVINFIGRQHALLTDIADQLNNCYAFQV